jgi:hypothetical protein
MASPDTSSAEWIAEAPSVCTEPGPRCQTLPLADFSNVTFSGASASTLGGPGRAIGSPKFHAAKVTLKANGIAFGVFGHAAPGSQAGQATPGALSGSGSSFTVSWETGASGTRA